MKKIQLIYCIVIHLFLVVAALYFLLSHNNSEKSIGYFHNEELVFQLRIDRNITGNPLVFIGDSHIQGLAVQEIFIKAVNFGIGSDTTVGVLNRLPLYETVKKAAAIVLAIGFNDLKNKTNNEIVGNILKIVNLAPLGKPIVFSLLLPIDEQIVKNPDLTNQRIHQLNMQIADSTKDVMNLKIINVSGYLTNETGELDKRFHTGDGIHLNRLGNSIYIDEVRKQLRALNIITD